MNVTIVGTGYVGLVTGACLAELGNHVFCLDVDASKVALLRSGRIPIHEPGLSEIVERNLEEGRLVFSSDVAESVAFGDLQFIAVGTPAEADGSADLSQLRRAVRSIGQHMERTKIIIQKSTAPVGTAEQLAQIVRHELEQRGKDIEYAVICNPEFLKEGCAIDDFMNPDRIVLGVGDDLPGRRALMMMRQLYLPFNRHHERMRVMDVRSAELTKYAANAMLATRISFMNELARLADRLGADIDLVRQGIGSDPRIGHAFLQAGTGYGGSCFPKDLEALCRTASGQGERLQVLEAVQAVNQVQKHVLLEKVFAHFGPDLRGRRFAVHGLAFKPDTDDMREAPSRTIIAGLLRAGARVVAHDPVAQEQAALALERDLADAPGLLRRLSFAVRPADALEDADALLLVTEWRAYRTPNVAAMKKSMKTPLVFDGRNLYDPHQMAAAGITCIGVGRSNAALLPGAAERAAAASGVAAQPLAFKKKMRVGGALPAAGSLPAKTG